MKKDNLFVLHFLSTAFTAIGALAILGFLNFLIIKNQFMGNLSANIGSIEISYIQMAKFWAEGGGLWQPLWYLGYPWHVFYTPVLPALEVLMHSGLGFDFGHAYRVITAAGYILIPISLFLFVWQISKSKTGAFAAGLIYTFMPSLIAFMFSEVAKDSLSGGLEPRRFAILVRWGEGPHTLALVFLPLFGVFASRFLDDSKGKEGRFADLILASIFLGLTAMTNAIAMWAAMLLVFAFFLSAISERHADIIAVFKKIIQLLAVTFGLISFWYNLPFLKTFFREGGGALDNWLVLFPWRMIIIFLIGMGLVLAVKKIAGSFSGLGLAIYWFIMLFLIVFIYYFSGEERVEYVPQALRLNTDADMALSVLIGTIISNAYLFFTNLKGKFKLAGHFLAGLVFIVPVFMIVPKATALIADLPSYALPLKEGEIEKMREYEVAKTLSILTRGTDQRVLVPGNYSFWLNYFEPVAQIRGALYQSSTHFWPEHIYYQVTNGSDSQITLAWLKIVNIGKLVYGQELFGDYKVPKDKFDSILKEEVSKNGITYYSVPLKNDSIAKLVDYQRLLKIEKPENAIDEGPITQYVEAIEQKSERKLQVEKVSSSHIKISGQIKKGEGILVQQTYDSGWRAKGLRQDSGSTSWKVVKDNFDFLVLEPKGTVSEQGQEFTVDLVYQWPFSVYLGYLISLATVGLVLRGFIRVYKGKLWSRKSSQRQEGEITKEDQGVIG